MRNEIITHTGVVKNVEDECVRVAILQVSACSGCAAKAMCSSAEAKEKEVVVHTTAAVSYKVGQTVTLEGRMADGRMAALIAYGLPLLLLLPVLYAAVRLTGSETIGALCALFTVALYYAVIAVCFRKRLQRQFSFAIAGNAEHAIP